MSSQYLQNKVSEYENYIARKGIDESVIDAMSMAAEVAILQEKDVKYGLSVSKRSKELIESFVFGQTGGTLWNLEKFSFQHKTWYEILDKFYSVLLLEAKNRVVDSYLLYLEKKREPKERFYAPKRKQFNKFGLIQAYQGAIDDLYDIICVSMPPGTGKTTLLKFFNSAVIGWYPNDYNLFYSHSGDITLIQLITPQTQA